MAINKHDSILHHANESELQFSILKFGSMNKVLFHLENNLFNDLPTFLNLPNFPILNNLLSIASFNKYNTSNIGQFNEVKSCKRSLNLRAFDLINQLLIILADKKETTTKDTNALFQSVSPLEEETQLLFELIEELFEFLDLVNEKKEPSTRLRKRNRLNYDESSEEELPQSKHQHQLQVTPKKDISQRTFAKGSSSLTTTAPKPPQEYFKHLRSADSPTRTVTNVLDQSSPTKRELKLIISHQDIHNPDRGYPIIGDFHSSTNAKNLKSLSFLNTNNSDLDNLANFHKLNQVNSWNFFEWGFKCSSLSANNSSYKITWEIWKNLLTLFIKYYKTNFTKYQTSHSRNDGLTTKNFLYSKPKLTIKDSKIYKNMIKLNENSIKLSSNELINVAFTNNKNLSSIKYILENDLNIVKYHLFIPSLSEESDKYDKSTITLGLDSIQIRKNLLLLVYSVLVSLRKDTSDFILKISENLSSLKYSEFVEFFRLTTLSNSMTQEHELLLLISINLLNKLTNRCFSFSIQDFKLDNQYIKFITQNTPQYPSKPTFDGESEINDTDDEDVSLIEIDPLVETYYSTLRMYNHLVNIQLSIWIDLNWLKLTTLEKIEIKSRLLNSLKRMDSTSSRSLRAFNKDSNDVGDAAVVSLYKLFKLKLYVE